MSALAGFVTPPRVSTLVVGDLDYDREDRGMHDVRRDAAAPPAKRRSSRRRPVLSRRAIVLAARDALVLELAKRTGLPLRDVREALREGRGAEEIAGWSPVSSREARLRKTHAR